MPTPALATLSLGLTPEGTGAPQALNVLTVPSGPVVYPATITLANSTPAPIVARLVQASDLQTPVGSNEGVLAESWARKWTDPRNETGAGSLNLQMSDPQAALVGADQAIRFELYGRVAFSMLVERAQPKRTLAGDVLDQIITPEGRGVLAILDGSNVDPTLGVGELPFGDTRTLSFASPEFVPAGWRNATILVDHQMNPDTRYSGLPGGYPALTTPLIAPSVATGASAPMGYWFFVKPFTLLTDMTLVIFAGVDDYADIYFDGFTLSTIENTSDPFSGYAKTHTMTIFASAGDHVFAGKCVNNNGHGDPGYGPGPVIDGNPTMLVATCFRTDASGRLYEKLWETDTSFKLLEYPLASPGFTAGAALRILHDEAVARGELGFLTLMFDDHVDSAGVPWPTMPGITFEVGKSYLQIVKQLVTAGYVDVWMEPGAWRLWMWNKGGRGTTQPVTFSEAAHNVVEQSYEKEF